MKQEFTDVNSLSHSKWNCKGYYVDTVSYLLLFFNYKNDQERVFLVDDMIYGIQNDVYIDDVCYCHECVD